VSEHDELTDEQVDFLLERFDQTEWQLQRRIIASFVVQIATLKSRIAELETDVADYKRIVDFQNETVGDIIKQHPELLVKARRWGAVVDALGDTDGEESILSLGVCGAPPDGYAWVAILQREKHESVVEEGASRNEALELLADRLIAASNETTEPS
jgi:hypothetical protein